MNSLQTANHPRHKKWKIRESVNYFILFSNTVYSGLVSGKTPSITSGISQYAISRAIRLWPVILFNIAFMYAIGDSLLQKDFKIIASAFLQCLTFTSNYADVLKYGSLTNTVLWSVCADYQIGTYFCHKHFCHKTCQKLAETSCLSKQA